MTPRRPPVPRLRHRLLLYRADAMREHLSRLHAAGLIDAVPTPFQVFQGVLYMRYRLLFRPESVGVGSTPVRATWRARWLERRHVRFPFLVRERVIAPWDLTGFGSDPAYLHRHLLGAYHPADHAVYDLALLSVHDGALSRLRAEVGAVIDGSHPRAEWLRDLCVYEGYHENLLRLVDRARSEGAFDAADAIPTDTTLRAFAAWMCARPPHPIG